MQSKWERTPTDHSIDIVWFKKWGFCSEHRCTCIASDQINFNFIRLKSKQKWAKSEVVAWTNQFVFNERHACDPLAENNEWNEQRTVADMEWITNTIVGWTHRESWWLCVFRFWNGHRNQMEKKQSDFGRFWSAFAHLILTKWILYVTKKLWNSSVHVIARVKNLIIGRNRTSWKLLANSIKETSTKITSFGRINPRAIKKCSTLVDLIATSYR